MNEFAKKNMTEANKHIHLLILARKLALEGKWDEALKVRNEIVGPFESNWYK